MQNESTSEVIIRVTREHLLNELSDKLHQMIFDFENKYNCGVLVKLPNKPYTLFRLVSNLKDIPD